MRRRRPRPPLAARAPLLAACALLGACAADPRFPAPVTGEPALARDLLERAAAQGPVPLEVRGAAPRALDRAALGTVAAAGVRGGGVAFDPAAGPAPHGYRLVLWFDGPGEGGALCAPPGAEAGGAAPPADAAGPSPPAGPTPPPPTDLGVGWCSGPVTVASAAGLARRGDRGALERLVWQTTGRLFPDPYPDDYGLDLFGVRVRLGGTANLERRTSPPFQSPFPYR